MTDPQRRRRARTQATLACGTVLGIIVAIILSGWNDTILAQFDGGNSQFVLQANTGSGWADYSSAETAAALDFGNRLLLPGQSVHAPIALRISPSTDTHRIQVYLKGAADASGHLANDLLYTIKTAVPSASCNSAEFNSTGTVPPGFPVASPLHLGSGEHHLSLTADSAPLEMCIAVTMREDAPTYTETASSTAMWQFVGELN
jgi:hypothetical protein